MKPCIPMRTRERRIRRRRSFTLKNEKLSYRQKRGAPRSSDSLIFGSPSRCSSSRLGSMWQCADNHPYNSDHFTVPDAKLFTAVWCGMACLGLPWLGLARPGSAWFGLTGVTLHANQGQKGLGPAGPGLVWPGLAWLVVARPKCRQCAALSTLAWRAPASLALFGPVWQGLARPILFLYTASYPLDTVFSSFYFFGFLYTASYTLDTVLSGFYF